MMNGARSVFALVTIVAWFTLSNHCALGSAVSGDDSQTEADDCPMHSSPAKQKPPVKTPCCKELRAVVVKSAAKVVTFSVRPAGSMDYAVTERFIPLVVPVSPLLRLDTGPPRAFSFAEVVLQESVLSHAPPLS
jgi:hypothetical protein